MKKHFQNLCTSVGKCDWGDLLNYVESIITPEMNEALPKPIEELEIKEADLICWEVRGLMDECLSERACPQNLNSIHIMLIPKTPNLESVNQFRPIILCNFLYKVLSKKGRRYDKLGQNDTQGAGAHNPILFKFEFTPYTSDSRPEVQSSLLQGATSSGFLDANKDNCKNISCLLHAFCEASGQEVSLQKSVVYFSANTQSVLHDALCIILNISKVEDPGSTQSNRGIGDNMAELVLETLAIPYLSVS
ncbi:hypothetical protein ACFXTI_040931 [Malus domestica]